MPVGEAQDFPLQCLIIEQYGNLFCEIFHILGLGHKSRLAIDNRISNRWQVECDDRTTASERLDSNKTKPLLITG